MRVDALDATLAELKSRGFTAFGAPVEAASGLRQVFLDPATAGDLLMQLVDRRSAAEGAYDVDGTAAGRLANQAR